MAAAGRDIPQNFSSPPQPVGGAHLKHFSTTVCRARLVSLLFPRLYYSDSRLFKSRERGDGRYAGEPRLRFSLRFPARKLALARLQPATTGRRNRRQPCVGMRSAASQQLGPVSTRFRVVTFLVFAHLPPPFRFCASGVLPGCCSCSSAQLRLLQTCRAPVRSARLIYEEIQQFSILTYTLPPSLLGCFKLLNQSPISVFLKPVLRPSNFKLSKTIFLPYLYWGYKYYSATVAELSCLKNRGRELWTGKV